MVNRTAAKLQDVKVGYCVAVFVSEFDMGRGDPANLVGVVLEIKNEKYRVGTRGGIIKSWLERNCFERVKYSGLKAIDVPEE